MRQLSQQQATGKGKARQKQRQKQSYMYLLIAYNKLYSPKYEYLPRNKLLPNHLECGSSLKKVLNSYSYFLQLLTICTQHSVRFNCYIHSTYSSSFTGNMGLQKTI